MVGAETVTVTYAEDIAAQQKITAATETQNRYMKVSFITRRRRRRSNAHSADGLHGCFTLEIDTMT